jgi:hypothetical protein
MIEPILLPQTLYHLDDYDLKLNWRVRCGATYDLTGYAARMTFWPNKTVRTPPFIYQIDNPFVSGEGIQLTDTSPNIWIHIVDQNVDFITTPPGWYILELQTPTGPNPETDGVWFRRAIGPVTYIV